MSSSQSADHTHVSDWHAEVVFTIDVEQKGFCEFTTTLELTEERNKKNEVNWFPHPLSHSTTLRNQIQSIRIEQTIEKWTPRTLHFDFELISCGINIRIKSRDESETFQFVGSISRFLNMVEGTERAQEKAGGSLWVGELSKISSLACIDSFLPFPFIWSERNKILPNYSIQFLRHASLAEGWESNVRKCDTQLTRVAVPCR